MEKKDTGVLHPPKQLGEYHGQTRPESRLRSLKVAAAIPLPHSFLEGGRLTRFQEETDR